MRGVPVDGVGFLIAAVEDGEFQVVGNLTAANKLYSMLEVEDACFADPGMVPFEFLDFVKPLEPRLQADAPRPTMEVIVQSVGRRP